MSTSVVLPPLGDSVVEGTVTRWLKSVGETVAVDEPLLEISTDKVDTEIPSPAAGVLEQILAQEDDVVEVGALLAVIGDGSGTDTPDDAGQATAAPAPEEAAPVAEEAPAAPAPVTQEPAAPEPAIPAATPASGILHDVILPELGDSVTEGTVTRWLKSVGDAVVVDEPLLEISTDKVDTEIPSPYAGTLQEILVEEDGVVDVGSVLGRIGDPGATPAESAPAPVDETPATPAPAPEAAPTSEPAAAEPDAAPVAAAPAAPAPATPPAPAAPADEPTYVTPLVRRLAQQQNVDLAQVQGTGVGGRIRKEDVLRAAEAAKAPQSEAASSDATSLRGTSVPMSRLRQVLADQAVTSMYQSAQLATVTEVDVTALAALRDAHAAAYAASHAHELSLLPFVATAVAEALRAHPSVNASVDGDQIVHPATENIAVAVDTARGMLSPVIQDASARSTAQLADAIDDLRTRTEKNALRPDELAGGTFTIVNEGARGALAAVPAVSLPQAATLSVGAAVKRPGVMTVDGEDAIVVRTYAYLTLAYDQRIIDGAEAAQFLSAVGERLHEARFDLA